MTPGITQPATAAPVASGGWSAHTWRLVAWNLMLARRRLMGKILMSILLLGFLGLISILLLGYALAGNSASSSSTICSPADSSSGGQTCQTTTSTSAAREGQQQVAQILTFPDVLTLSGGYVTFMGIILFCVLAGAQVGNEYSQGTHRLALSRGASRAQLLIAQIAAFAILALAASLGFLMLGALIGISLGPLLGGSIPDIPAAGWAEILGFWLLLALRLFAYMLIALLLATAGRSTAAGIAGALGYVLFENIALPIIIGIALAINGLQSGVVHLQDFFVGPNLTAALNGVSQSPLNLGGTSGGLFDTIAPSQGLAVAILYCLVFIGLSYLTMRNRDVTH